MDQKLLYQPIKKWLESKDFKVLITGGKTEIAISVGDIAPALYKIPDLMGIDKTDKVVIVEVEKEKNKFFDALGRCMLWKSMATFVYMACPKNTFPRAKILEKLGVGLLEVSRDYQQVEESIIILPSSSIDLRKVQELHPLDFTKEQQLAKQIKGMLNYETRMANKKIK